MQQFVTGAQNLYGQGGPKLNPDSRIAPFNESELAAQKSLLGAITPTSELADWGQKAAAFNLGPGRDPASNPYLQSAITAATRPITENLLEQALPNIRNQSALAGTFGGSRQGIAEGNAVRDASRAVGDVGASLSNQAYQSGQANATNTLGLLPQLQNNWTFPAQLQGAIGSQERALQEAQLNENADRYEYYQQLPYNNLLQFGNAIRQPFGAQATSEVTVPPPSTGSQIAGGILSIPALIQILKQLGIG